MARRAIVSFPHLLALTSVSLLLFPAISASAQTAAIQETVSSGSLSGSDLQIFSGQSGKLTSAAAGSSTSEVLRGNGSRIGYKLTHGNVLTSTVRVRASGQSLKLDQDFWIDSASGSLIFAQAIRPSDSVSVYYRYVDGPAAGATPAGIPGLRLDFGGGASLGLVYNAIGGDGSGIDTSLYGLTLGGKLGRSGLAQFGGMAYFANTQLSSNLVNGTTRAAAKPPTGVKLGMDHLITQSLGLNNGRLQLHADYQDVGKAFAGFQSLKASSAGDKAALDQLTALEGEKGVRRMGFGLNLANNPAAKTPEGLALQWNSIADAKGGISQESIGYTSRSFRFNYASRDVGATFASFAGLREAEKAQWQKERGLTASNLGFGLDFARDKKGTVTGGLDFASQNFKDKTGSLSRDTIALNSGPLQFAMSSRRVDAGFKRIGDLSDADKTALALDTRRELDPNAKPEQVTQKDRDQLAKESGIERSNLRAQWTPLKPGALGAFTFSQFRIADRSAATQTASSADSIQGMLFGYTGKSFQLNYASRSIGSGFTRLGDLSELERQQFGNARGLSQQALNGAWQINKTTKLTFSSLDVGGTHDAVMAAESDARSNSRDVAVAAKTAAAGVKRFSAAFETTGLTFSAAQSKTATDFSRAADLPVPDADKHQIDGERGMARSDYALHFARVKGVTIDGTMYDASNAAAQLGHKVDKIKAEVAPNKSTKLTFQNDVDLSTAAGKKTGIDHTLIALNQGIGKSFLLNLMHDANATYDKDAPTAQSARTDALHLESLKTNPNNFAFDAKRIGYLDGRYENSVDLNVHAKPMSSLALNYSHQEIDRGTGKPDSDAPALAPGTAPPAQLPSESTNALDGTWQATKQFAVVFGFSQRDTTDKTDGDTVSVGLKGDPVKNLTVTAKFDELHNDGKNTKDVADFALSNAKPIRLGCIQDLTISAHYASLNDQRKLQNETMTGRASWKIWKNEFLLDYGGLTTQNGQVTISRLYSFTTDPNPKKWFHGGFFYKVRTMVDGTEKLIRRFTADWRITPTTNFVYTYGTLPEDDKGNILPQTKADIALKHAIRPDLSLQGYYRLSDDGATKKLTRSLGFGIDGKINRLTKFQLAYSLDTLGDATLYDHSNHYRFLLDRQVDADHFLTLSTDIHSHDGKDLKDEIQANLDFRIVF